jgi:hypothetical protein
MAPRDLPYSITSRMVTVQQVKAVNGPVVDNSI